jgi:hypothetical protein
MTTLHLRRSAVGLVAADADTARALGKIEVGQRVRVTLNRPRNMKLHARYFVLCQMVADHHEQLRTSEQVDQVLRILTGHCDTVMSPATGELFQIPRSLKLSEMNAEEFEAFYRRACDAAVEHLLPGVGLNEVREEVLRLVA